MKAILVIDIDDEEIEDLGVNYLLYRASDGKVINGDMGAILKPMPSKRETIVHWKSIGGEDIPTHEVSEYDKGWNDCVDFLEGEEE